MSRNHPRTPSRPLSATLAHPVTVLVVGAIGGITRLASDTLPRASRNRFRIEWATTLAEAFARLARDEIEIILVAPDLAGRPRLDVFDSLRLAAPNALVLPVVEPRSGPAHADDDHVVTYEDLVYTHWLPGTLEYVAQRKANADAWRSAEEALFEEKERARVTLESIGDAVLVTDAQGNVTYLNPVAEDLTGWSASQARGRPLPDVFHITEGESGNRADNPAMRAMTENATVGLAASCVLRRPDGGETGIEDSAAPVHDRHGTVTGAVIVFRDINQSRAMTSKKAWLASHDALTGLANRVLLEERFRQVISLAHRNTRQAAILFVDLDNFKQINDIFGHRVGDRVLQSVADMLLGGVRETDTVCRHGGDEFIILLAEVASAAAAEQTATILQKLFSDHLLIDEHNVKVMMSMGISMYPDDGEDMHALIEHADFAMYKAKAKGRSTCKPETTRGNAKAVE